MSRKVAKPASFVPNATDPSPYKSLVPSPGLTLGAAKSAIVSLHGWFATLCLCRDPFSVAHSCKQRLRACLLLPSQGTRDFGPCAGCSRSFHEWNRISASCFEIPVEHHSP